MMGQIYSNSLFTLIAEDASDVHGGLLRRRPAFEYPLRPLSFDFTPRSCDFDKEPRFHNAVSRSPLRQRGWTLQERIMSTRTLHISAIGMFWNCVELAASEHHPTRTSAEDIADLGQYIFYPRMRCRWNRSQNRDELIRMWMDIVRELNTRRFTVATDKLPALSGVARAFYNDYSSDDQYLGGMWESMLPNTLLWSTRPSPTTSVPSQRWRERIPGIPTWSCLSITSPFLFE
ncbi:uncharacterized protein A1O5_00426, partial [Cladophialophora psammophila CBS 110553]